MSRGAGFCPPNSGSTSTEWRTERESFRRVCSYTASGIVGPAFFTVESRDGSRSWYGNTADSFINPNTGTTPSTAITDRALLWAINQQKDAFGNVINYAYTEDSANGEFHLDTVRYAANDAAARSVTAKGDRNAPCPSKRTRSSASFPPPSESQISARKPRATG